MTIPTQRAVRRELPMDPVARAVYRRALDRRFLHNELSISRYLTELERLERREDIR